MNNYEFTDKSGATYKRINKKQAGREYLAGNTIILCPCNLRPFSPWAPEFPLNRKMREQFIIDEIGAKNDFYNYVASYEYYNCTNSQTGKYTAYYIAE